MVDLSGGQDGPIEHGFSNIVFIVPGIVFISLSEVVMVPERTLPPYIPPDDGGDQPPDKIEMKFPNLEKLMETLDKVKGLTVEEREQLKEELMRNPDDVFMPPQIEFPEWEPPAWPPEMRLDMPPAKEPSGMTMEKSTILFSLLFLITSFFLFFGYKLYRHVKDRETMKEEKKKLKQRRKRK